MQGSAHLRREDADAFRDTSRSLTSYTFMRRHYLIPALVVLLALFVAPAQAQSMEGGPSYGVGASFNGGFAFTVPIRTAAFRLEPQLGYTRSSTSRDGGDDSSNSTLILGAGAFTTLDSYESTDIYAGGRLGIQRNGQTDGGDSESTTDFFLGPALGGEHFLGDHFSLGAEVGLYYRSIGTTSDSVSRSRINTSASTFVRLYL